MTVDYGILSKTYDDVRNVDKSVIELFLDIIEPGRGKRVLDFGCGTGNYANSIKERTDAEVFGVEPSDEMREKASLKNPDITFMKGDHEHIPFDDDFFDFAYMTDVIHHVPDLGSMFRELNRVLKFAGLLCIVTESHRQIDRRFYARYFPSIAVVDKKRYPDIEEITEKSLNNRFAPLKTVTRGDGLPAVVTHGFLALVKAKGFSMFHLIPEPEYQAGLEMMEKDLNKNIPGMTHSGETLVWLKNVK